jgi:hypothetical protein
MDVWSSAGIWIVVAAIVLSVLVKYLARPKQLPRSTFTCARCSTTTRHSNRTAEAWRNGAKRLYCDSCHRKWLSAQPQAAHGPGGGAVFARPARSGCLGASLVLVLVPFALVAFVLYA